MNLKKYPLLGLVFLLFLIFSGCAKKEKIKPEKVTLRFSNWEVTPEQLSLWQEVVDKLNQTHPDIHIKFEPVSGGTQPIIVQIAGGMAPDIFFWDTHIVSPLIQKKAVLDLTPFIKKDKINPQKFFPSPWQGAVFEGKIVQFGGIPPGLYTTLLSFGGRWFDRKGNFTGNSPQVKEALSFIQDMRYRYKVSPSLTQLGPVEEAYRQEMELFMTGKIAMFSASSWTLSVLKNIKTFRWDVAPLPRKKGRKRKIEEGAALLVISSQSKHPQQAWEFVKFATYGEGAKILARGGNAIPALKEVAENYFVPPPENIKVFYTQIEEVVFSPSRFPWYPEWNQQILIPERDRLFLNLQTPEELIKNLKKKTEEFLQTKEGK